MSESFTAHTDETLAAKARQDKEAEAALLDRYKDTVRQLSHAYYILGGDQEDVVQEGMIGLFRAIHTYDEQGGASFKTYATTCISRQMVDAVKSAARKKHEPLNTSLSLSEEGSEEVLAKRLGEEAVEPDPEAIVLEEGEDSSLPGLLAEGGLEAAVKGPWKNRFSAYEYGILTGYLAGKSYETIAEELGKRPKSIYNAMGRIKTKIRRLIEEN